MGQLLGEESDGLWEDCPLKYVVMYLCCQCCWFRFESLVVSGWIWSVYFFLFLFLFFFCSMKCRCYTAANKWVSCLEEYVACLQKSFLFIYLFIKWHVFTTFLTLSFFFFFALFHSTYVQEHIFYQKDSPWLSPNFWQILYHKDLKTGVWVCKSLSFNDFLCLCPVRGSLCFVSVMVIAGRVKSVW